MDRVQWWDYSIFGILGYVLFILSEIMALSKIKSNGVVQFVSRRVSWLGGKHIRIEFGVESTVGSGNSGVSSVHEEEEEEESLLK
jgi:hypothetical protein